MHERGGDGQRALAVRKQRRGAPTCDAVFNLPLHLEGVHVDGPVPDEACARNAPVWLAEAVLVVVVSGEDTAVSPGLFGFLFKSSTLFIYLFKIFKFHWVEFLLHIK